MISVSVKARENAKVARVRIDRLRAHPRNVRTNLGDLRELAASIRQEGVLVPLMAEERGDHLQLLHGHRRWAAAHMAGALTVPVVIVDPHTDRDAILLMLAEDRKEIVDLRDRRRAVRSLHDEFGMTWAAIATRLGVTGQTAMTWGKDPEERPAVPPVARPAQPPRIRPHAVHDLLTRCDSGEAALPELLDAMREWLGDWRPAAA